MATAPANVKALETGSGLAWDEWVNYLDSAGARDLDHTALATLALARIEEVGTSTSPEWWAQGVAVAYEQHIGRRLPGQRGDGDFSVTISKTIPGDMDAVLALWNGHHAAVAEFDGVAITREPATSATEKWRYWRCGLEDGSSLSVNFQTKPPAKDGTVKTAVAINHDHIGDADAVERWRTFWKGVASEVAAKA